MQNTATINEGWGYISNSPKWHYFRNGRSLCGRWGSFGRTDLEQGNDGSPDNCKACRTKITAEKAKASGGNE
jgi:hypothetical protein